MAILYVKITLNWIKRENQKPAIFSGNLEIYRCKKNKNQANKSEIDGRGADESQKRQLEMGNKPDHDQERFVLPWVDKRIKKIGDSEAPQSVGEAYQNKSKKPYRKLKNESKREVKDEGLIWGFI